jgi:hypothetical protein
MIARRFHVRHLFTAPAFCGAFLLLASTGAVAVAHAQPEPTPQMLAKARAQFKEARRLEDAGQWNAALERFQEIARVKMTPAVRFHLALCAENVGLWTQALDGYAQAVIEARERDDKAVLGEASEHLRALSELVPTLSVQVIGAIAGDELHVDHQKRPLDGGATPLRLDPGPHEVELRRGGVVIAKELVRLEPRAARRIELQAPRSSVEAPLPAPLEAPPPASASSAAPPPPSAAPSPLLVPFLAAPSAPAPSAPPIAPAPPRTSLTRWVGWSTLGLAGASGIAAGVFAVMRASALDDLNAVCASHTGCDASVRPIVERGKRNTMLLNVFGALTLFAGAGGTARSCSPRLRRPRLHRLRPCASRSGRRWAAAAVSSSLEDISDARARAAMAWALFAGLAAVGLLGCTFPTVDYSSTGAGGSMGDAAAGAGGGDGGADAPSDAPVVCIVPSKCATDADTCSNKARGTAKSCTNKCKPPDAAACEAACNTQLAMELATCSAECVTCSTAKGCPMQEAACEALVGM